jgi:MarR family transcriptional regulator, organic hydroperoxide resistance regulator
MHPAEEIRYLILAAQREGNRQFSQALKPLGLTSSQAEAIRLIADHQPLTMTQLGAMLICESGTNPSRLVDRLVASGQIERKINAADRRAVSLRLTSQGSAAAVQIAKIEEGMYAMINKMLSDTESERLIRILRALVVNQPSSEAIEHRVKFKSSNFKR